MSRLKLALLCIVIGLPSPAAAQERVLVGTQRLAENGALFLAAAQGYFKAEGIDLGMTAYESDQAVAETLAAGTNRFRPCRFHTRGFQRRRQRPDQGDRSASSGKALLRGQRARRLKFWLCQRIAYVC
jgi:NMT1/THI5 like